MRGSRNASKQQKAWPTVETQRVEAVSADPTYPESQAAKEGKTLPLPQITVPLSRCPDTQIREWAGPRYDVIGEYTNSGQKNVKNQNREFGCEIVSPRNVRSHGYKVSPVQLPKHDCPKDDNVKV
ncbi:hypothetical protein STEG23_023151 [Scotinomys teguina]